MTNNQLNYWANIERERANRASEKLQAQQIAATRYAARLNYAAAKLRSQTDRDIAAMRQFGVFGNVAQDVTTGIGGLWKDAANEISKWGNQQVSADKTRFQSIHDAFWHGDWGGLQVTLPR